MRRARGALALVLLGTTAALPACMPEPDVALALRLPGSVRDAAWFEVGAVPGGCPAAASLLAGIPLGSVSARVAFPASATRTPTFGALSRERWAFVATARDATCGVAAIGCKSVDLATTGEVTVNLLAIAEAREGVCSNGLVCQYAHCIAVPGANVPSAGGCTLATIGGGALADPLSTTVGTRARAAAPAVASAGATFLVSAIDAVEQGDRLRLVRRSVDEAGSAASLLDEDGTPCTGTALADGVSVVDTGGGRVLEARRGPGCSSTELVVSEYAAGSKRALYTASVASGTVLGPRSLSRESGTGRTLLATLAGAGGLRITTVGASSLGADVTGLPAGVTAFLDMASTASATLWLARGANGRAVAGVVEGPTSKAIPVPEGTVAVAARGADFDALVIDASGFVRVERVSAAGASLGSSELGFPGGVSAASFTGAALASRGEFMVAALATAGEIFVAARSVSDAATLSTAWKRLGNEVPLARRRRDGGLAFAASTNRMALVWNTSAKPTPDDVPFGYAVLGCEERTP
jgi:hypothetical protein